MLLRTEQVPRSADRQVPHGNLEAGAKLRELLNGLQPLLRHFSERLIALISEVGVSNPIGTANPSPQLIQLGKPHFVRIMHNQRIHVRNIHTGLNNARTYQDVIFTIQEVQNRLLELLLRHLSMPNPYFGLWHKHRNLSSHLLNTLNPVIQVVYLASSGQLSFDRFTDKCLAVLNHIGLYRKPILWRCLNDR
ncbi:hypothetical protein D3C81_1296630 [compost metagenome]